MYLNFSVSNETFAADHWDYRWGFVVSMPDIISFKKSLYF